MTITQSQFVTAAVVLAAVLIALLVVFRYLDRRDAAPSADAADATADRLIKQALGGE